MILHYFKQFCCSSDESHSSEDEFIVISCYDLNDKLVYLRNFSCELDKNNELLKKTANKELKRKILFFKRLVKHKFGRRRIYLSGYQNELAEPQDFFNLTPDLDEFFERINNDYTLEDVFPSLTPKINLLKNIIYHFSEDFNSLLSNITLLHEQFANYRTREKGHWNQNILLLLKDLRRNFRKSTRGRYHICCQLKTLLYAIDFDIYSKILSTEVSTEPSFEKIQIKKIIKHRVKAIIQENLKIKENIEQKILQISYLHNREILDENKITELLNFLYHIEFMLWKNNMFECIYLCDISLMNHTSVFVSEENINNLILRYLIHLSELRYEIANYLWMNSFKNTLYKIVLKAMESSKFNLVKYFKLKIREEIKPLRKNKIKEFCDMIASICDINYHKSKIIMKKMLKSDFKSTNLSSKQLTYFSILSLDAVLDINPLYKGLNSMNMRFEGTLLDLSIAFDRNPHVKKSIKRVSRLLKRSKIKPFEFIYHEWPVEEIYFD